MSTSVSCFGALVGIRRRLRLSFDLKLLNEPRECRELCENVAEVDEPSDPEDSMVKPVSSDAIEGARKNERLPVLGSESCLFPLRLAALRSLSSGKSKVSTLRAIACKGAGSFSGGECCHRSKGSIAS